VPFLYETDGIILESFGYFVFLRIVLPWNSS